MNHWFYWLGVTLVCLALCTYLPIRIKNDRVRRLTFWFVLIPVSLLLILYAYPAGIEVFRNLALSR